MKKRILCVIMALCIVVLSMPVAFAAGATSGSWGSGNGAVFTLENGVMNITGTSEFCGKGWRSHFDITAVKSVIIGSGIQKIDSECFKDCTALTSIEIPNSITMLGDNAFIGSSLESVVVPSSVTYAVRAFNNCTTLKRATVNSDEVDYDMFNGCTALESVTLSSNLAYIRSSAFYNCSSLKDVYYAGTQEQWQSINKHIYSYIDSATIHYGHTHSYTEVVTAPTCVSQGYTTHTCALGESFIDSYTPIDKNAHGKTELKNVVKATCTEKGYTGDYVCTDCLSVVTYGSETAATGHQLTDGVCDICGEDLNDGQGIGEIATGVYDSIQAGDYPSAISGTFKLAKAVADAIHTLVHELSVIFDFDCPFCDTSESLQAQA